MTDRDNLPVHAHKPRTVRRLRPEEGSGRELTAQSPRPIVVVLGMHRSGTSLLSNVLHVLGVDMADTTDHVSPKNPGGFWERPELVAIQDEVLEAIGRPIRLPSHVLPFPAGWWRGKAVQAIKPKLVDYVGGHLEQSSNPWGFKDPRTCRLLPLWWEVFRELNIEPIYVNAVRSPAEASVSMSQKSPVRKLSVANSELMWLSYNYDLARHVMLKSQPIMVDYGDWFADPNAIARRLCEELGVGQDLSPEEMAECVSAIVQPDYRHQFEDSAPSGSIATMFYKSLIASNALGDSELRALRGQVRLVDMFFKSIAPVVDDLDTAAATRVSLETERDELTAREAAVTKELAERTSTSDALARSISKLEDRLAEIEEKRAAELRDNEELKERLATAEDLLESETSAVAALQRRFDRERKRSRAVLRKARQWRASYVAEHGEPDDRLETAARAAELNRLLSVAQQRLATAEEMRARFGEELELRDRALAQLRRETVGHPALVGASQGVFAWPRDGEPVEVAGAIDRVDSNGIAGHVVVKDRGDLIPVVEVRVDHRFIAAQTCTALHAAGDAESTGRWHFSFTWGRFGPEHSGKEAVILVGGAGQELGRALVPADLAAYHASPAARASSEIGGSVAEAAEYHRWILEHESPEEAELARAYRNDSRAAWPLITALVHGGDAAELALTLRSLRSQVYANWQALCVDASSEVADIDPRVRVVASEEIESALREFADDDLFTFVEAGDSLAPTALLHLAEATSANPDFVLIYSDEDITDPASGLRALPFMKGGWSPDLALARDYVSRLALIRRDRLTSASVDRASVYETTLKAGLSGSGPVVHLPFVLYHRAADKGRAPLEAGEVLQAAIKSVPALNRATIVQDQEGRSRIEWPVPDPEPRVSLIVPTRDRADLLRVCVGGFLHETRYDNLEILIADNDSQEEDARSYLSKVSTHPRVRVIPCPGPFNFSKINNVAARHATGELIGLVNNDIKVLDPEWLREMVRQAVRPDIGIVGAKLLYDDGTIQHAGVTLGIGLASHLYKSSPGGAKGRQGRLSLAQDVSAVTAACLVTRREVWDEVGGLDEDFPVAYNDVDFCLKVRAAGYRILWTPDAVLYHLESRSRGKDATPEKRGRLDKDKARLIDRWGAALSSDPFHSPNFSAVHTDSRLAFPSRAAAPWLSAIAAQ